MSAEVVPGGARRGRRRRCAAAKRSRNGHPQAMGAPQSTSTSSPELQHHRKHVSVPARARNTLPHAKAACVSMQGQIVHNKCCICTAFNAEKAIACLHIYTAWTAGLRGYLVKE